MVLPARAGGAPPRLPEEKERAAELLRIAGDGFQIRNTDHFMIAYDAPRDALLPLVGRLEGIYDAIWRFCKGNELPVEPPPHRLRVILFDDFDAFARYAAAVGIDARSAAGFYHHQTNIAAFCNTANTPNLKGIADRIENTRNRLRRIDRQGKERAVVAVQRRRDLQRRLTVLEGRREAVIKTFNRFVIQHEAAHQMLFNLGVHVFGADNPPWLVEGLACQFEVPQSAPDGRLRRVNQMRLADFRDALGVPPGGHAVSEDQYKAALAAGRLVPLADLIGEPQLFAISDENTVFRYAQAWAFVYSLHRRHRDALAAYLRALHDRRIGERVGRERALAEFQSFFGDLDSKFEKAWIADVLKLRYKPNRTGQ